MIKHDAYRQIGYLQQALSQNRKPIGIFPGASCPLSVIIKQKSLLPIIPDTSSY